MPEVTKSCFNCAYFKDESTPQTYWEPACSDWSCGHKESDSFPYDEPKESILTDDSKFAEYCAKDCPGYEFKDWDDYYKQQAIGEAELEEKLAEADSKVLASHRPSAAIEISTTYKEFGLSIVPEHLDMYGNNF